MPGVADKLKCPQKTDQNMGSQRDAWCKVAIRDQTHETPVHGELNTISGGFSGGGSSTSKRKRYARAVMSLDTSRLDHPLEPTLCFTSSDLEDLVPHEDDSVVIYVVTVGQKVHAQSLGRSGELN